MIKKLKICFMTLGLVAIAPTASAVLLSPGVVGDEDHLVKSALFVSSSSLSTELSWAGVDYTAAHKNENLTASLWHAVDDGNPETVAFDLSGLGYVTHVIIKIGQGSTSLDPAKSHFLYLNKVNMQYLYINLADLGIDSVASISHLTFLVPEPATLSLLGAGLLAMGLAGRRRRRGTGV